MLDCLQLINQVYQKEYLRKSMKTIREVSSRTERAFILTDIIRNLEDASDQTNVHAIATLESEFKNHDSPFLDCFPVSQYTKLCHREWRSRTWVIQELCVPERPIFVCGKKMISYHDFLNCSSFLNTYSIHKTQRSYLSYLNRCPHEEPDPALVLSSGPSPANVMMSFRFHYQNSKGKCTL